MWSLWSFHACSDLYRPTSQFTDSLAKMEHLKHTHTHTHTHTHSLFDAYTCSFVHIVSEANTCTRSSPVSDFNRGGHSEAVAGLADCSGSHTAELVLVRCVLPEAEVFGAWGSRVFVIQVHCVQVSSHLHGNSTGKAVSGVTLQGFQFCQSNVELAIINCRGQFFFILDTILQTRFQKSWDTVQMMNKNWMQWCGSFKFQYFIQNTTQMTWENV